MTDAAEEIAEIAQRESLRIAVAESLTGGVLANRLAKATGASDWFAGAVVAYTPATKQRVLDCSPGPVITERTACEMAAGVAKLMGADAAVSTTGVGGPGREEGEPPGTVWIGRYADGHATAERFLFEGDPAEIVEQAANAAVDYLLDALTQQTRRES